MAGLHELSRLTGLTRQQVVDVFDAVLNLIRSNQRVSIKNFGSFWETVQRERMIVSSALVGGKALVPEAKILRFRAAPSTKMKIKAKAKAKKKAKK